MFSKSTLEIPSGTTVDNSIDFTFTVNNNLEGGHYNNGSKVIAEALRIPTAPVYSSFETIEDIEEALKDLPVLEEGYVCYIPEQQWRIKIKNPSYLAVAHMRVNGVISAKKDYLFSL